MGFGLRTTIVVNITLVMFITMLLIGFVVLTVARKTFYDNRVKTAETMVTSLQELIVPAITSTSGTGTDLKKIVDDYMRLEKLHSIVIVDSSQNVIAADNQHMPDLLLPDGKLREALNSGSIQKEIKPYRGSKHLNIAAPLLKGETVLGAVQILLPLAQIEESMAQFQRTLMLFTITTALLFIIIGSFLLTRYLVRPLEKLIRVTQDITDGYIPKHLDGTGSNEIASLSLSLARMSNKLREDKEQIDNYIHSLQETNSKLKLAQDEVIRSEKLSSVGRLAAGVAHEIGNPIGIILGYIEILRQQRDESVGNAEALNRLETEVLRIDSIIRELLSFSRPSTVSLQPIQVNTLIQEATSLISHQKEFRAIKLELTLEKVLPIIMADERLLQQVLVNLFINAMDAMPDGGKLMVSSEHRTVSNHGPLDYTIPEEGITIMVRDTGAGINPEHINKIFDPFYTTKSPGKGTGLGLSVCHRIIESLGGVITVQSIPGEGTTFAIILPASQEHYSNIKHSA